MELISREAAIEIANATRDEAKSFGMPQMAMGAAKVADDIRALPAQAPAVKVRALEWVDSTNHVSALGLWSCLYVATDDGWRVISMCKSGAEWHSSTSLEAAKAAAQADYESRILAALDLS